MSDTASDTSSEEFNTPPLRLGDPDAGEDDVVWIAGRPTPDTDLERELLERDFLAITASDPTSTAAQKQRAHDALRIRMNNPGYGKSLTSFIKATLSKGAMDTLHARNVDADLVEPAVLGTVDTVSVQAHKEFTIGSGAHHYSGPTGGKGPDHLRRILEAANATITNHNLSAEGAFSLLRDAMRGEALTLLNLYRKDGKYQSYMRTVQLLSRPTVSRQSTMKEIMNLINTKPAAGGLGDVFHTLFLLHDGLVANLPAKERPKAFTSSMKATLFNYISLWFPHLLDQVMEKYNALRVQMERQVDSLRQKGKDDEAAAVRHGWCDASALIEASLITLSNQSPSQLPQTGSGARGVQVAQLEQELDLGAEASSGPPQRESWYDWVEEDRRQQQQRQQQQRQVQVLGPPPPAPSQQASLGLPQLQQQVQHQVFPQQVSQPQWMDSPHVMAMGTAPPGGGQQQRWTAPHGQGQYQAPEVLGQPARPFQAPPPLLGPPPGWQRQQQPRVPQPGTAPLGNFKPKCPRCLRHDLYNNQNELNPCYRFPQLAPGEESAICNHCGGVHYSQRCNQHIKMSDLYPQQRPDVRPPLQPTMFTNQAPAQPRGNGNRPPSRRGNGGQSRRGGNNGRANGFPPQGQGNGPRERLHQPMMDQRPPMHPGQQVNNGGRQGQPQPHVMYGARPKQFAQY